MYISFHRTRSSFSPSTLISTVLRTLEVFLLHQTPSCLPSLPLFHGLSISLSSLFLFIHRYIFLSLPFQSYLIFSMNHGDYVSAFSWRCSKVYVHVPFVFLFFFVLFFPEMQSSSLRRMPTMTPQSSGSIAKSAILI